MEWGESGTHRARKEDAQNTDPSFLALQMGLSGTYMLRVSIGQPTGQL
jgi:hypothetical protein